MKRELEVKLTILKKSAEKNKTLHEKDLLEAIEGLPASPDDYQKNPRNIAQGWIYGCCRQSG